MNMSKPWEASYPKSMKWQTEIDQGPVFSMLDKTAQNYPDSPAFNFMGKKWTWAEIDTLSRKMAQGLQRMGAQKGTKIGLFLPNSPYFLISYYAIMRTGATAVNFNPLYSEGELEHQIEDSETSIMITADLKMLHDKMAKMLTDTRLNQLIICPFSKALPFPKNALFNIFKRKEIASIPNDDRHISYTKLTNNDGQLDPVNIDPKKDVALLQYTGGTTGVPKGAMLTHSNVTANAHQCEICLTGAEYGKERVLGVLPFFHVFAMTSVMNLSVRLAAEITAIPRFELEPTLKLIDKEKPTLFPVVPAILNAINNHSNLPKYNLKSLTACIAGGAPLPLDVQNTFENLTGCKVVEGYGLTESSPVLCVNPLEGERPAGSIGLPVPGTEIDLRDAGNGKSVALGEKGELCARGPQVMTGYWNKLAETQDTFYEDGFLRTGDVAKMDENGYFYIVDRIKDLIITNGHNVYPRNVEEAIQKHPSIEECIVGGLPDKARGEIVKAWIKLKDGRELTESDLTAFLSDKISPMEMPRRIEFRDEELPKTMIGKLSRKDVIAQEATPS